MNEKIVLNMWTIVIHIFLFSLILIMICFNYELRSIFSRERRVDVPVIELHSQELVGATTVVAEARIPTLRHFSWWSEKYEIDFDIDEFDFTQNQIILLTNHRVKSFSYDERSRRRNRYNFSVLDIVLYPERTGMLHLYKIPREILTWDLIEPSRRATIAE